MHYTYIHTYIRYYIQQINQSPPYLAEEVLNDSQSKFVDFSILMLLQCLNLVQTFTLLDDHTHLLGMAQLLGSL